MTDRDTRVGQRSQKAEIVKPGFFYNTTRYLRRGKSLPDLEVFA